MFAVSNRNIILPGPDGERLRMPRGWMGPLPAWAEKSTYLAALAVDGKVILSTGGTDKELEAGGRRKKNRNPAEEPPAGDARQETPPSSGANGLS